MSDASRFGKIIDKIKIFAGGKWRSVDLRFDGRCFAVQIGNDWIQDKDIDKVKKLAEEKMRVIWQIELKPYIEITLRSWHGGRRGQFSGGERDDEPVIGFTLTWSLWELSEEMIDPGSTRNKYRLGREANLVDGKCTGMDEPVRQYMEDIIPYTPKALAALEAISLGIHDLYGKLESLLEGEGNAKALETLGNRGLLALAEKK